MKTKVLSIVFVLIIIGSISFLTGSSILSPEKASFSEIIDEIDFGNDERMITADQSATTAAPRYLRGGNHILQIRTSGEGTYTLRLSSANASSIAPDTFTLSAGSPESIHFTCYNDVDALYLELTSDEGEIQFLSIRISDYPALDSRITLSLTAVVFAVLGLLTIFRVINRKQLSILFFLFIIAVFGSIPCFQEDLLVGDDTYYHWERLTGLIAALRSGEFPVRFYPTMNNGFGGVAAVFYPDISLYPFALLVIAGASMQYAFHLYIFCINLLTAFAMYKFAGNILQNKEAGLIASVLYSLSPYRMTNLYFRSALGEALAMALLPLFLHFLLEVMNGDRRKWPQLAILAALLPRAHMITTLFALILSVLLGLFHLRRILKEKRFLPLGASVLFAVLLYLPVLVPMITYTKQGISTGMMWRWLANGALSPTQLLWGSLSGFDLSRESMHITSRPIELGIPMLVCMIYYLKCDIQETKKQASDRLLRIFTFIGICAALASTTLFPWARLQLMYNQFVGYIQFPWRLLLISLCLFAVPAARYLADSGSKMTLCILALCLMFVVPIQRWQLFNATVIPYNRAPEYMNNFYLDYNFEDTIPSNAADRSVRIDGQGTITEVQRAGTELDVTLEIENDSTVLFPLYAFEIYEVTFNDTPVATFRGNENRLAVHLPEGSEGILHVRYIGNPLWQIGDGIAVLSLFALLGVFVIRRKRARESNI